MRLGRLAFERQMITTESSSKRVQAAIAGGISALIIGLAVLAAVVAGDGGDPEPPGVAGPTETTLANTPPSSVGYVNYETPEALLAGHAGKPLVINFFASWCAPCRAELPDLAAAHATYGDRVDFVGVDFQEISEKEAAELLWESGITYRIMEDPKGLLLQELGGLPTMPTTIFVAADSEIIERHHGLILESQLTDRIEEIIAAS